MIVQTYDRFDAIRHYLGILSVVYNDYYDVNDNMTVYTIDTRQIAVEKLHSINGRNYWRVEDVNIP